MHVLADSSVRGQRSLPRHLACDARLFRKIRTLALAQVPVPVMAFGIGANRLVVVERVQNLGLGALGGPFRPADRAEHRESDEHLVTALSWRKMVFAYSQGAVEQRSSGHGDHWPGSSEAPRTLSAALRISYMSQTAIRSHSSAIDAASWRVTPATLKLMTVRPLLAM